MLDEDVRILNSIEKHYRIKELKPIIGLSDRSLRRLFDGEPGIVVLPHEFCRNKRKYELWRIGKNTTRGNSLNRTRRLSVDSYPLRGLSGSLQHGWHLSRPFGHISEWNRLHIECDRRGQFSVDMD